jgi:tetratricopeptide (TPR) repeat protein
MLAAPTATLRVGTRNLGELHEFTFTVERYSGDWAWIRTITGREGWVPRRDIVPLEKAVDFFTRKIAEDPSIPGWYHNRAAAYQNLKQYGLALADLSMAIALDSRQSAYYNSRANLYDDLGDFDRALADYNTAIRLDPGDYFPWYNAALLRQKKKEYDKAIQNYTRAILLSPSTPMLYYGRGRSWREKGNYERAMADFDRALQLDSKDAEAYNALAALLATCPDARYRDGNRAVNLALKACELSAWSKPHCISTLAEAYAETNDFEKAVEYGEQALRVAKEAKETDLSVFNEELELFKKGKPYRTPEVTAK